MYFTTDQEAEAYCREQLINYLEAKGINTSRNFRCLNPNHRHNKNTPSMSAKVIKGKATCRCWGDCNTTFSIFDIMGFVEGITDFRAQKEYAYNYYGIEVEKNTSGASAKKEATKKADAEPVAVAEPVEPQEPEEDYTRYYVACNVNKGNTGYWESRGISENTQNILCLGIDENIKRAIIPNTTSAYVARDITGKQEPKILATKGERPIYNPLDAWKQNKKPVFIVEGEIDAASIIEAGGLAVGLGGTNKYMQLAEELAKNPPPKPVIIALDNDTAGAKTTEALAKNLDTKGIKYIVKDIYGKYIESNTAIKDANDALIYNRTAFKKAIAKAEAEATTSEIDKLAAAYDFEAFEELVASKKQASFKTGLEKLDAALNGGLYEGLYSLGAICGLGKTTLALQIADHVAKEGKPVFIFSLEQNLDMLRAKSISRLTFKMNKQNPKAALDARQILTGNIAPEAKKMYDAAVEEYKSYAQNIYVFHGRAKVKVSFIKEKIEQFEREKGQTPLIIIDYLQILDAADDKKNYTDKQIVDTNINELADFAKTRTIISISSFNRDNYEGEVNTSCYKETGNIEYSSYALIGLQYNYMRYEHDITTKTTKEGNQYEAIMTKEQRKVRIRLSKEVAEIDTKEGKPVKIDFVILKDKLGTNSKTILNFYPKYNCYDEWEGAETQKVFKPQKQMQMMLDADALLDQLEEE